MLNYRNKKIKKKTHGDLSIQYVCILLILFISTLGVYFIALKYLQHIMYIYIL